MAYVPGPTRTEALDRMSRALEAAKHARDRGADVREARVALREARAAFEAGNYAAAAARADDILRRLEPAAAPAPTTPTMPTWSERPAVPDAIGPGDVASARSWLVQAEGSVREAKGRGLNVNVAKAALSQAKRALKHGDYRAAIAFANQAVQLCALAEPARR